MQAVADPHCPLIQSPYLDAAFRPERLRAIIASVCRSLRPHRHEFDSIAFRGLSGALIAPTVAAHLRKYLLCVRKAEQRHSPYLVEGNIATERYCIVDDFVSTGRTVESIIAAIEDAGKKTPPPVCWGLALWKEVASGPDPLYPGEQERNTTEDCIRTQFRGRVGHVVLARRLRERHGNFEF